MASAKSKSKREPSLKAKKAFIDVVENGRSVSSAMVAAGYSENTAKVPGKLTKSKSWQQMMEEYLPDKMLAQAHQSLISATKLDHMVFPLEGSKQTKQLDKERSKLSDEDIIEMLAEVGCTVRKIVHGEQARHVYFWAADHKPRKDGIDMAYKLKGSYAPEKSLVVTVDISNDKKKKAKSVFKRIGS